MEAHVLEKKIPVAVLGATGMVGQRFIQLLENHPWFEVACVAASPRSAGMAYAESVEGRWAQNSAIPEAVAKLTVLEVETDIEKIAGQVVLAFSAMSLDKEKVKVVEEAYAAVGCPIVSNNSAHRWTPDVPMMMPEINGHHAELVDVQRKNRGWDKGFIVVKPNCSIQSYVPVIDALMPFGPERVVVSTYQAISGAGKTFDTWPEMVDNMIPYIGGEEKKSEDEPKKVWGTIENGVLKLAEKPVISANCIRVPVSDGHLASVNISFSKKPTREEIVNAINHYENPIAELHLPSSPVPFMQYFEEDNRPQISLDRMAGNGMGITVGRLREDNVFDWKFVGLSHNTIRGAAGGAVLTAEMMVKKGYVKGVSV